MATASTSNTNLLEKPPTKLEFQRITTYYWQIYNKKDTDQITLEKEDQQLQDFPNFSCTHCYPGPPKVDKKFYNFFNSAITYQSAQYIIGYSSKTIEIFNQYTEEEDTQQRIQ